MKHLTPYDEFLNEELNLKKTLATGALAGAVALGASGQMSPKAKSYFMGKQGKDLPTEIKVNEKQIDLSVDNYNISGAKEFMTYDQWVLFNIVEDNDENKVMYITKNIAAREGDKMAYSALLTDKNLNALNQQMVLLTKNQLNAGKYQVRGVNKLLTGTALSVIGAGVTIWSTNNAPEYKDNGKYSIESRKIGQITGLLIGLSGLGLDISGILDIRKAGVSLNGNGITLKIDF